MKISKITYGILIAAMALAVYIITLSPSVSLIDSGELALVAQNLGIAHPTGYPLYTLISRIFVSILPVSSVLTTNFASAVFSSMAVLVFFFFLLGESRSTMRIIMASLVALAFAFSRTFWSVSVETEVYALEMFLNLLAISVFYRLFFNSNRLKDPQKYFWLGAFLLAISFTNHMLTILFLPSIVLFSIWKRKAISLNLKSLCISFLLFILGLSIYIYLPIRSLAMPEPNWGDPKNLVNIIRHVSGWQYQTWMFESSKNLAKNIQNFFEIYMNQNFYLLPVLTLMSIVFLVFKKNYKKLLFWLLIIFVDFIYAINYSIPDIEAYFLPLFISSFALIYEAVDSFEKKSLKWTGISLVLILAMVSLITNFSKNDRSDDYFARNVAYSTLIAPPNQSLVFLENWDFFAPARYIQKEYGFRDDLVLVDFALLKRSWYIKELRTHYPKYFLLCEKEIENFLLEVKPFEQDKNYNPQKIEAAYRKMIFAMVEKNIARGIDVYGFVQWKPMNHKYYPEPEGFLMKYNLNQNEQMQPRFISPSFYFWQPLPIISEEPDPRRQTILKIFENNLLARTAYLSRMGYFRRAIPVMKQLLELEPDNKEYIENHAVLHVKAGLYEEAKEAFSLMESFVDDYQMQIIYKDLEKKIESRRRNENQIPEDERDRQ
ncbi:MAG: protein O-mannosyl-transferase family [Candidatus Zixiibacteriota bacterium]